MWRQISGTNYYFALTIKGTKGPTTNNDNSTVQLHTQGNNNRGQEAIVKQNARHHSTNDR